MATRRYSNPKKTIQIIPLAFLAAFLIVLGTATLSGTVQILHTSSGSGQYNDDCKLSDTGCEDREMLDVTITADEILVEGRLDNGGDPGPAPAPKDELGDDGSKRDDREPAADGVGGGGATPEATPEPADSPAPREPFPLETLPTPSNLPTRGPSPTAIPPKAALDCISQGIDPDFCLSSAAPDLAICIAVGTAHTNDCTERMKVICGALGLEYGVGFGSAAGTGIGVACAGMYTQACKADTNSIVKECVEEKGRPTNKIE
jgi:hypothetical protein